MAEQCDLTTPDQAQAGTIFYKVALLALDWENKRIKVVLVGGNGLRKSVSYEGATAEAMLIALNKANLSLKSLHKRILGRVVADGNLTGSISGTPD